MICDYYHISLAAVVNQVSLEERRGVTDIDGLYTNIICVCLYMRHRREYRIYSIKRRPRINAAHNQKNAVFTRG